MTHYHPEAEARWRAYTAEVWGHGWYIPQGLQSKRPGQHITPERYDKAREAWERAYFGGKLDTIERQAPALLAALQELTSACSARKGDVKKRRANALRRARATIAKAQDGAVKHARTLDARSTNEGESA